VDRHVVRLQYPPFGDEDFIKLEGWMLEFGEGAGTAHLDLPARTVISHESEIVQAAVADLSPVTDRGIDPALVKPNPGSTVISRVTLHAGSATHVVPEALWELDDKRVELASELTWIIPNVPGESLVLRPQRLDVAREPEETGVIPELVPNSHGVIELRVFHVLEKDFPPPLRGLDPHVAAQHFSIYYDFYPGLPAEKKKLPIYREPQKFIPQTGGPSNPPLSFSVGCNKAQGRLNDD
jgi:hypothetical protein